MVCSKCGEDRTEDDFNFRVKSLGVRHKRCKLCTRTYGKNFYEGHKKERIALSRKRVPIVLRQNVERLVEYLFSHPCVDCSEKDPLCLDFDHVKGTKRKNISGMLNSFSWKKILEEIEKCVVRCANCHRRKTAEQFGWIKISVIEEFMRRKTIG